MADRIKLQVTEVSEPKEVGQKGAKKLSLKAKSPDGKELSYFTFRTSIFEFVKKDASLDAEVEVKTREYDGNTYTDRQINQIFIDGNPVGGQARQWQGRGDTPEQRQSIETQTACKIIAELRVADILKDNSPEYQALLKWCGDRIIVKADIAQAKVKPKPPSDALEPQTSVVKEETKGVAPLEPDKEPVEGIDMSWVRDSIKQIKWTESTVKSYLSNICKVSKEGSLEEVIARLSQEQKVKFTKEIQDRLDMA